MRVRVLYHDHCFDGAASAAFFSRFYAATYAPDATFDRVVPTVGEAPVVQSLTVIARSGATKQSRSESLGPFVRSLDRDCFSLAPNKKQ